MAQSLGDPPDDGRVRLCASLPELWPAGFHGCWTWMLRQKPVAAEERFADAVSDLVLCSGTPLAACIRALAP